MSARPDNNQPRRISRGNPIGPAVTDWAINRAGTRFWCFSWIGIAITARNSVGAVNAFLGPFLALVTSSGVAT